MNIPIPILISLNVALSRQSIKSLDPSRIPQKRFSSSKWRLGPKILSLISIADISTMSSPVFLWRIVPLMLFRTREYKTAISAIKCPDSVHSTFKFDWNRSWMFQLLEFCDTIHFHVFILSSEFRMIKDCFHKRYARRIHDFRQILDRFGHFVPLEFLCFDDAHRLQK